MMLRIFFCLVCLPCFLRAQVQVASFEPRTKPDDFVFKVSGQGKPLKYLFQNNDEYEIYILDSVLKVNRSIVYRQVDKKNRFTASLEDDSLLSLYFIHVKTGKFGVLKASLKDSGFVWKELFEEKENEHFLKAVPVGDKVCALSVVDPSGKLLVRSYRHGRLIAVDMYPVEYPNFIADLKSNLNFQNQEPFSDMGITLVDSEVEQDISDIYTNRKIYVRDNMLVMTFDETNTSHLVFIDLTKKKSYYKKFSFKLDLETASATHKGNSFLLKDYFFRVTSNGHQINVAVIDFRNFTLVRNLNAYDDQPIEIKNGPLLSEESTNGSVPRVQPIKSPDKFFKKMRGADLGVTARQLANGNYELMVGSHYMEVYTNPVMGPSMGMGMGIGLGLGIGLGGGFPVGGAYDPLYYPYGMSQRSYSVTIEKTYFHSIVSNKSFAHLQDPLGQSYQDRKKLFWSKSFRSGNVPEIAVEYLWKDAVHYGYWDRKQSRFIVLQFEK